VREEGASEGEVHVEVDSRVPYIGGEGRGGVATKAVGEGSVAGGH
jgi:hypothetical protein